MYNLGGKYALERIGSIVGTGMSAVHNTISQGSKLVLTGQQLNTLVNEYKELPHGCQVLGADIATGSIIFGMDKIAGSTVKAAARLRKNSRNLREN